VNDRNAVVYYRRGLAYYKNKDYVAAIKDLNLALQHGPSKNMQADIHYHIGIAYSNLEQYEEALAPLSKAIELEAIPKYFHERAKCEILLDKNDESLQDLN
jgi:tetratricopeptide (TPR) repeat protein